MLTLAPDQTEVALTRKAIREVTGRDYRIDLEQLDPASLIEVRRLVRDLEARIDTLRERRRLRLG